VAQAIALDAYLAGAARRVDAELGRLIEAERGRGPERLWEALAYALFGGGKRMRPALAFATAEAFGGESGEGTLVVRFAASLEMVHGYSLVHDDLPCMDDDDLRRGRPTVHKAFGEATAVLVGDALQSLAFGHLVGSPDPRAPRLAALLSSAATRMVEGQALDLAAEGEAPGLEGVLELQRRKTGALLAAAVVGGAVAATGSDQGLSEAGLRLGLAFQIADDLLDLTATAADLGKRVRKDAGAGKATLPALLGAEEARRRADEYCEEALRAFEGLGARAETLRALARYVVARRK